MGKAHNGNMSLLLGAILVVVLLHFLRDELSWYESTSPLVNETPKKFPRVEKKSDSVYLAADVEDYIMNNFEALGYNNESAKGCLIWSDPQASSQENYDNLHAYRQDLDRYTKNVEEFDKPVPNLVRTMQEQGNSTNQVELCKAARLHPDGVQALFPSMQVSLTPAGYVEPLLTPMRHPEFCEKTEKLLELDYLVHDFEKMCLNLKPSSRSILIDMGASLKFHGGAEVPIVVLMKMFHKFGFYFDHIYAFEVTEFDPKEVFNELLPEEYMPSYHWINTGVSAEKEGKLNPLHSILSHFDEDDLIVVKLDIDTASVEVPLAKQLLADESLHKLVDHFYFEHHVHMDEIKPWWGSSWKGTVQDTFELMNGLRKKGVASHFWV